jgi:hypothetical protein
MLRPFAPVWVSVIVAAILFSVGVSMYPRPSIVSDALGYTWSAYTLAEHHAYNHSYFETTTPDAKAMPGYPLFLSIFYAFAPEGAEFEEAVRAIHPVVLGVQFVLAVATVALIAACGMATGGQVLGFVAGLMASVYMPFAWTSSVALTETLGAALLSAQLLIAVLIVRRKTTPTRWLFLGFGLLSGLLVLVRPIYLPWFVVPLIVFAMQKRVERRDFARLFAFAAAGLLLMLAPWWVRNAVVFNKFVPFTAQTAEGDFTLGNPRLAGTGSMELTAEEQAVYDEAAASGENGDDAVADMRLREEVSSDPAGFLWDKADLAWRVVGAAHIAPMDITVTELNMPDSPSVVGGVKFSEIPERLEPSYEATLKLISLYQWAIVYLGIAGGLFFMQRRPPVLLAASIAIYAIVTHSAILFQPRYFFPTMPAAIMLAATAAVGTASLIRQRFASSR